MGKIIASLVDKSILDACVPLGMIRSAPNPAKRAVAQGPGRHVVTGGEQAHARHGHASGTGGEKAGKGG